MNREAVGGYTKKRPADDLRPAGYELDRAFSILASRSEESRS